MFGWYREQIAEHGSLKATKLLVSVASSRARVKLSNKFLSVTVACPCCGWKGRRFHDYIEVGYRVENAVCPQCESHSRHRYLFLWASQNLNLENKSGRVLVFAPERALDGLWSKAPHLQVHRVDIEANRGVDLLAEIERLPVASDAVDLIWCHHVLEHVENDRAAMRETLSRFAAGVGRVSCLCPDGARDSDGRIWFCRSCHFGTLAFVW